MCRIYNISWNGCAEEYPIVHPIPYGDCTDQDHGGYGLMKNSAQRTIDSPPPGWQVHFDEGVGALQHAGRLRRAAHRNKAKDRV